MTKLYDDAQFIIKRAINAAKPDAAVRRALGKLEPGRGRLVLVAAGKAAWQMADAAVDALDGRIERGVVITKYGHVRGQIPGVDCYEAGHPVPDANSFAGTEKAIEAVADLTEDDTVLFLLSGGGSALFEKPLVAPEELASVTRQLLASGAAITEINTVRKRLSAVKGGRFALLCRPAKVFAVVLSDIIGDPLDMIASGPAYPDSSTCRQAKDIVAKYSIQLSPETQKLLDIETPKVLDNVTTEITGSVKQLCVSAEAAAKELGYETVFLTDELCCQAREAGSFLGTIARSNYHTEKSTAYICGGETVVKVTGSGLGGRNQEIALSAAAHIGGLENVAVFSVGSDGTDGPTDAAGGYVDGTSVAVLSSKGLDIEKILSGNDSYNGLKECGGLIVTGPTGTNVNDLSVVLIKK